MYFFLFLYIIVYRDYILKELKLSYFISEKFEEIDGLPGEIIYGKF